MTINEDILKEFKKVWKENVFKDVIKDKIWMEADLVASFYHHIRDFLEKIGMHIYLEDRPFAVKKLEGVFDKSKTRNKFDGTIFKKYPNNPQAGLEFKHFGGSYPPGNKQLIEVIGKDIQKLNDFKEYEQVYKEKYPKEKLDILKLFFYINRFHNPYVNCDNCKKKVRLKTPKDGSKCCLGEKNLISLLKEIKSDEELNGIYVFYGYCPTHVKKDFSEAYKEDLENGNNWEHWWGMKEGSKI